MKCDSQNWYLPKYQLEIQIKTFIVQEYTQGALLDVFFKLPEKTYCMIADKTRLWKQRFARQEKRYAIVTRNSEYIN